MKIGFLGTPEISAYVLQELVKAGYEVKWVITQPDKNTGRGQKVIPQAVKQKALELGITKIFQPIKPDKDFFELIKAEGEIDLGIVIAYGHYIPFYLFEYPKFKMLNIHTSLLPEYRGASPITQAICDGKTKTGVTIMKVAREMDAGEILSQVEVEIKDSDNTQTLSWELIKKGTELLIKTIPDYVSSKIKLTPQDSLHKQATVAHKVTKECGTFNWSDSARSIHNKVRAYTEWPGVNFKFGEVLTKIKKTSVLKDDNSKAQVGEVVAVQKNHGIAVKTGDGILLLERLQPSGKKELSSDEFINGYRIQPGMMFLN